MELQIEQWCQRAKVETMKTGAENILKRSKIFQDSINEEIQKLNSYLNLKYYPIYNSPIQDINESEKYMQWILKIKTPEPEEKKINNYKDMKAQISGRYNYLKSKYFGDELFPTLFKSLSDYAIQLSKKLLIQQSVEQQKAYQSILIKFCWSRVFRDIIEFPQSKPTSFICKRSITNKSCNLYKLLKEMVSKEQFDYILTKYEHASITYDEFPKDLNNASSILEELGDEELKQYRNHNMDDANIFNSNNNNNNDDTTNTNNIINSMTYQDTNIKNDENTCFNNNNFDIEFDNKIMNETQNIQNDLKCENFNNNNINNIQNCKDCQQNYNNYTSIRSNCNFNVQELRFDPGFCRTVNKLDKRNQFCSCNKNVEPSPIVHSTFQHFQPPFLDNHQNTFPLFSTNSMSETANYNHDNNYIQNSSLNDMQSNDYYDNEIFDYMYYHTNYLDSPFPSYNNLTVDRNLFTNNNDTYRGTHLSSDEMSTCDNENSDSTLDNDESTTNDETIQFISKEIIQMTLHDNSDDKNKSCLSLLKM